MTTRDPARRPLCQAAAALLCAATALTASIPGCYSEATGTSPPTNTFYFPVGLAVSPAGNVLYVANSDFDLQWNGGTLQSYNLFQIRQDTAELINANFGDPNAIAYVNGMRVGGGPLAAPTLTFPFGWVSGCQSPGLEQVPAARSNGTRLPIGQACSPPVNSTPYVTQSNIIGAFATDLQLSKDGTRLFAPVRGDETLTWANICTPDTVSTSPPTSNSPIFSFDCGAADNQRCSASYQVGAQPDPGDTRQVTLPGEPFAFAQTPDGTAIAVTHQTSQQTSLLLSGLSGLLPSMTPGAGVDAGVCSARTTPSMQFVLTGVPTGGDGIAAVPHDPDLFPPPCENVNYVSPCVRPAFLETSHSAAEIDLLRYYNDDQSSINRPFLVREAAYTLSGNIGGTDQRDIVIDPTPRLACKSLGQSSPADCAKLPARVFIASRTPPSLILGEIGEPSVDSETGYNPDTLVLRGSVPLTVGPSRLFLAPIVDRNGNYALRVFIVCYDAAQVFVYDPDAGMVENVIDVGPGPFAMAFDPFDLNAVAAHAPVPIDTRQNSSLNLKTYRFGYLAIFTQSYLQLIDLDDSLTTSDVTFERPVFTLGVPTNPKGS